MQDLLATRKGVRLPVRAAEIIGRRIVSGTLPPGTRLPDFDDLAAEMSISPLSVRQALRILAEKGLVSSGPYHGMVVQPQSAWSRLDADVLIWRIGDVPDANFVDYLFEVRRMIEPDAAAIAAARGDRQTIARMEQALAAMGQSGVQTPESIRADLAFHKALLTGTGNEFIAAFAPLIETLLSIVFDVQRDAGPDPDAFVPDHQAVLDAIKRRDAEAARQAAAALLDGAKKDAMKGIRLLASGPDAVAARSMSR